MRKLGSVIKASTYHRSLILTLDAIVCYKIIINIVRKYNYSESQTC